MTLGRLQKFQLFIIIICTVATVVFAILLHRLNHGMNPPGPQEETHHVHTSEGKSQLAIDEEKRLEEHFGEPIANAIASQLYAAHYQKSSKLEKDAELVELKKAGKSTTVTVKFSPSGDTMTARVTVKNAATNDFDISIEGVDNE